MGCCWRVVVVVVVGWRACCGTVHSKARGAIIQRRPGLGRAAAGLLWVWIGSSADWRLQTTAHYCRLRTVDGSDGPDGT